MKHSLTSELGVVRSSLIDARIKSNKLKKSLLVDVCKLSDKELVDKALEVERSVASVSAQILLMKTISKREIQRSENLLKQSDDVRHQTIILDSSFGRGLLHNAAGVLFVALEFDSIGSHPIDVDLILAMGPKHLPRRHHSTLPPLKELSDCGTPRCHRPGLYNFVSTLFSTLSKSLSRQVFSSPQKPSKKLSLFVQFLGRIQVRTARSAFDRIASPSQNMIRVSAFIRAIKELGFSGDVLSLIMHFDRAKTGTITFIRFAQILRGHFT